MSVKQARRDRSSPSQPSRPTTTARNVRPTGSQEARRIAAAILEVLAGSRTPVQAASALAVSVPRYYLLEQRAIAGLLTACEPRVRGPGGGEQRQMARLERQLAASQRECARQQALVRVTQRTIGLPTPPPSPKPGLKTAGKKARRRRPTVRALKVAAELNSSSAVAAEGVEQSSEMAARIASTVEALAAR